MTQARDIMHVGAECVGDQETLVAAATKMRDFDVGILPICGDDDHLRGVVTDRDIVVSCLAQGQDPSAVTAGDLAQDYLWTVDADAEVDDALALMERHQVRRVPVLDDGRLVGMIGEADLARHLSEKAVGHFVEVAGAVNQPLSRMR